MTELLADLEPRALWSWFLQLSEIPRPSGQEAAAARWVVEQARALGCHAEQDAVGNVLIRKAASPGREDRPTVALQCHIDMVCEKNEGTTHDFTKDPIRVRRDGDVLRATGTTLGADNGIGVATALAVLSTPGLVHPPIEILVTVDEETGLTGANHLRGGWLGATTLLNLDSEEEGELTIGCAGGVDTTCSRVLTWSPAPGNLTAVRVKVGGLKGGHSGVDIDQNRGNSLRVLGHLLAMAPEVVALADLGGGNKRNAIPREARAVVYVDDVEAFAAQITELTTEWTRALGAFDPHLHVTVEPADDAPVMSAEDKRAVLGLLLGGPHGVEAMSPDIRGLVQTSTNLGLVEVKDGTIEVNFLSRSSIDSSKHALTAKIAAVASACGFTVAHHGNYPGWKPEPGSSVVRLINEVHTELFGKPMLVKAIHAGLECGLIGEKYPGMEMASIGPTMADVHTPDEHVSIPSVATFWKLLVAILARL